MPELPEVETVCRGLASHLTGRRISKVTVRRRDLRSAVPPHFESAIEGAAIQSITRRAKYIVMHLSNAQALIVHLGMSGSMVLAATPAALRKHDHVVFTVGGFTLTFHDPRRFGLMALAEKQSLHLHPLLADLGGEPMEASTDGAYLYHLLHCSKAPVKSVLMDQKKLVGVGNIYACEALFRAKIHPLRRADSITSKEAHRLMAAVKDVLEAAIASGGSTLRDYVRSSGDAGYFQHHFSVYGRKGLPCVVCGHPVSVLRQSGRSTFLCGHCQK